MSIHKSAEKSLRKDIKRHKRNIHIKKTLKTLISKTIENAKNQENKDKVNKLLKSTISSIDKAARKGIIHKNTAARKKSKLMKKIAI